MLSDTNLVTVHWLRNNIDHPRLTVLFTQMDNPMAKTVDNKPHGFIPNSIFFDFEQVFCARDSDLPHTMPSEKVFTNEARKLGISKDSIIVIYDNKGIYCAPRAWWMFKSMGHDKVYVLNGGLPAWLDSHLATQSKLSVAAKCGDFRGRDNPRHFITAHEIMQSMGKLTLLDARSAGRFNGTQSEPRQGLRSGHIPNSVNLPYEQCLDGTYLLPPAQLNSMFKKLGVKIGNPLVLSCGSGVTACILALAASVAGFTDIAVYDGSWSEWGAREELPVEPKTTEPANL